MPKRTRRTHSPAFKEHKVRISMERKGRWIDNVYVECFWRNLKVEEINLHAYATPAEARGASPTTSATSTKNARTKALTT